MYSLKGLYFLIFHILTHTENAINSTLIHPNQYKKAVQNSLIKHLLTIPMSKCNFDIELNIINQFAINKGYNTKHRQNGCKEDVRIILQLVYTTHTDNNITRYKYMWKKRENNIIFLLSK